MIDLSRNRAELLAEIGAVEPAAEPLSDLTDPRVGTTDVHVRVHGHAKKDLFPLLKVALSGRFAAVSRQQLIRDLLVPLRNALGNAYKHGNARNPEGRVCVEIVLTRHGALIAVTDEGPGFDVALTFRRFQAREDYCENRGAGFRNLHRARSTVSYVHGGRTLLLCFRPAIPARVKPGPAALPLQAPDWNAELQFRAMGHDRAKLELRAPAFAIHGPEARPKLEVEALREPRSRRRLPAHVVAADGRRGPASAATVDGCDAPMVSWKSAQATERRAADRSVPGVEVKRADREIGAPKVLNPGWIQSCLSAVSPEFGHGQTRIESCRVYAPRGPADDGCGNRYVLRIASHDGQPAEMRILTGRLHASEAAAGADFEAANRLYQAAVSKRLLIPRPVGRFSGEPPLVLYDFDAWMDLSEYLIHRGSLKSLCHAAERTGQTLAALHRSRISFGGRSSDGLSPGTLKRELQPGERFNALAARVEKNLQTLPGGADLVSRFRVGAASIQEWGAARRHPTVAPIHGAMGWDCIHFGVDGRFYLYRFESCRQSDPGLDLGGFAADLLSFTLACHNEEAYRASLDTFLSHYNAEAEHPMGENDLRFYLALALVERLGRAETCTRAEAGQWLAALDVAVGPREALAASEVSP